MVESLIAQKSLGSPALRIAWSRSIQLWIEAGAPPDTIAAFAQAFRNPQALATLAAGLEATPDDSAGKAIRDVFAQANDSGSPVAEWTRSLELVAEHLASQSRSLPFSLAVGYVACAEEFRAASSEPCSLSATVAQFLERHGIEPG